MTLHLPNPTPRTSQTQTKANHDTKRGCNLYSLTRNIFASPVARHSKVIMTHQTHTKTGLPTLFGLAKGYIQSSPHYPETKLSICMVDTVIYVEGKKADGSYLKKPFTRLKDARKYLKQTR